MGAAIGYGCYEMQSSTGPCTAESKAPGKRDGVLPCPLDMSGEDVGGGLCQSLPPVIQVKPARLRGVLAIVTFLLPNHAIPPNSLPLFSQRTMTLGSGLHNPRYTPPGLLALLDICLRVP